MVEVWYLVVTLFVLEGNGTIDKRSLNSVKQDSEISCKMEANARRDLYRGYLSKDHIRRFSLDETYEISLSGKLVAFTVGCEPHLEPPDSTHRYR